MQPDDCALSAIVVSYNTRETTLDCLRALDTDLESIVAEVIVVDNASIDGSSDAVRAAFPSVRIIQNQANIGFGAANNRAMVTARGEFFLLINSDAFLRPGAVKALMDLLGSNPRVGVVGPRLLRPDGSHQVSCFPFPSPGRAWLENLWLSALFTAHPGMGDFRRWPHNSVRLVPHVIGACMLVRKEVWEQVGGFDERFFMYSEEADWEQRIRRAGWEIAFTPDAESIHLGGASSSNQAASINRHFFHSLDLYALKHHGKLGLISFRVAMSVGCLVRWLGWLVVATVAPGKRAVAVSKARLHGWLFLRQSFQWKLSPGLGNEQRTVQS